MRPVGIDLGTTISLLGIEREDGRVAVINTRDGGSRLRSIVHVAPDGSTTVGEAAERLAPVDPDAVFAFFKRSMGKDWTVTVADRDWTPQKLSAAVLEALLSDAAIQLQERPRQAVITIPAYFGDDARRATREAAESIELEVLGLLHEPTAACIASRDLISGEGTVLVYDLGGGTFDVSVVAFHSDHAEVLATAGDHRLGGKDWDDLIVDIVAEGIEEKLGDDPRDDPMVLVELQERAREAKHALSRLERTAVTLHAGGGVQRVEIDRADFWGRGQVLFDRTRELVAKVIEDIGGVSRIDGVILAGGSTRMPACAEAVRMATGLEPLVGINADEAVVEGAALYAAMASLPTTGSAPRGSLASRIVDITAHALGFVVVSADGSRYVNEIMIPRNAPLPTSATKRHRLDLPSGREGRVLSVYMLQGESERPLDTAALGAWTFSDIPGDAQGSVEVNVCYSYNEDGVVEVSASLDGSPLAPPSIDRSDRDLSWTEESPSAAGELTVVLTIDVSASMQGSKLTEAKNACCEFIDELERAGLGDRIAVVSFGSSAHTIFGLGGSPLAARRAVEALSIEGSTNLAAGLGCVHTELAAHPGRRVVVVLTDGAPDDRGAALSVRHRLVKDDIELIARGVAGADAAFLDELATGGSELVNEGDLGGNFRGIARQLLANSVSRV